MIVRKATTADTLALAELACCMWGGTADEREPEFAELTASPEAACFLALDGDKAVGFAQCQLRHDYVEGCETSPVGFLEGVYVQPEHHHKGIARQLVAACEDWARSVGCTEFGSDCEIDNTESLAFHLAIGFEETGRTIWFHKKL